MKTIEEIRAEHEPKGSEGTDVAVVRLQLSFGDVFILAVQLGIVWAAMGLIGFLLFRLIS